MKNRALATLLISGTVIGLLAYQYWRRPMLVGHPATPEPVVAPPTSRAATSVPVPPVIVASVPRTNGVVGSDLATIRQEVRDIANLEAVPLVRQKAVRALPDDLSFDDRQPLLDFLREWHSADQGQFGQVLKNDVMDALVNQRSPAIELPDLLVGIARDSSQNFVIRDYAIQHLALLSERLSEPTAWDLTQISAKRYVINEALWQASSDTRLSLAGTALMGLLRLAESRLGVDAGRLSQSALKAMTAADTDEATRISALQVGARLQSQAALPVAVQLAAADQTSPVRIAAIGALGALGGKAELELLKNFVRPEDARLRPAVTLAMQRVGERLSQP